MSGRSILVHAEVRAEDRVVRSSTAPCSHLLAAAAEAARVIEECVFTLIAGEVGIDGGQALQRSGAAATAAGCGARRGPAGPEGDNLLYPVLIGWCCE